MHPANSWIIPLCLSIHRSTRCQLFNLAHLPRHWCAADDIIGHVLCVEDEAEVRVCFN